MAWTVTSSTTINLPNGAKVYEGYFDGICDNFSYLVGASTAASPKIPSSVLNLTAATSEVAGEETTSSTSYVALATPGPSVVMSPGAAQNQLIIVSAYIYQGASGNKSYMSPNIAGAGALDADAAIGTATVPNTCERTTLASSVANGSTHTALYRVDANTGYFGRRRIIAVAI